MSAKCFNVWRGRTFAPALEAAGLQRRARPYDLRHSFASLLLHEGRSVIYVARQLGHSATRDTRHLRSRDRRALRATAGQR